MPVTASQSFDAIVVGAGIVGLCAATLLARHHRSVALLAPATPAFRPSERQRFDPRVYAISGKSQRFLSGIKAWDAMPADRVTAVEGMDIWGDDTRHEALTLRARDSGVQAITWLVEQQSLLDALELVARFAPGLTRIDDRMLRMEQVSSATAGSETAAGDWRIYTAAGTVLQAPLVFAADGAGSAVRAAALLDFPVEDYNALGVVGTFRQEHPHDGVARQWFLGSSVLALLPLPDQCVSMVWSMDAHQHALWQREDGAPGVSAGAGGGGEQDAGVDAGQGGGTGADSASIAAQRMARRVMQAADGRVGEVTGRLDPCGELAAYPLRHGVAPLWFADGVVLLGDAAHLVHPLAGQGLNIGIEDVADLEPVIAEQFSAASLRTWQRARKAGAQPIHWLTHGLNGLFRVELPGAQWLRNTGMQMVNQVPAIKRWLVGQAMR